jgi:GNAT superfamily N-acetyltransferase
VVILAPPVVSQIEAAVGWIRDLSMSVTLRVRDDLDGIAIQAAAEALGLERDPWVEPGMVLHPLTGSPPTAPGLRIETATPETLHRWYRANAAGFGLPEEPEGLVRDLMPEDIVDDPNIRLFGGFVDGTPVACSAAIRSDNVVGVYAVGTAESARRRGIGSALTWAAVDAGRAWGSSAAVLQASDMGEPLYRTMGFRAVTGYVTYEAPRPSRSPSEAG